MPRVLLIDDDPNICLVLAGMLSELGYDHESAHTIEMGRTLALNQEFDLVLLDLELPDGNGLDLISELTQTAGSPEVIIITGTGDVRGAELAFKFGAWDYVQKPFLIEEVTLPITRALQYRKEKQTRARPVALIRKGIIGDSDAIIECLEEVARAGASDMSILITGETGTGKELFAKAIHENSKRRNHPFVAVDCGALPETLVESTLFGHAKGAFTGALTKQEGLIVQAQGGTLMLDEVGDLPLAAQKSLLRTLQERVVRPVGASREIPVDIRLIAATNVNLGRMVGKSLFREDLLYRIRAAEIKLPPLRERSEDIEPIAVHKLHELSRRYEMEMKAVSPEFLTALNAHDWPGNIRELANVLEYVLASAGADPTLFPKHLPPQYRTPGLDLPSKADPKTIAAPMGLNQTERLPSLRDFRDHTEKSYLKELIRRSKGDRRLACRMSGISQSRLYSLLKRHHLSGFGRS